VGLGLAIAQWAVKANAGAVAFLDREGPGALCRITLPAD
jgi:K+-sensing histidine kinase KdpD